MKKNHFIEMFLERRKGDIQLTVLVLLLISAATILIAIRCNLGITYLISVFVLFLIIRFINNILRISKLKSFLACVMRLYLSCLILVIIYFVFLLFVGWLACEANNKELCIYFY